MSETLRKINLAGVDVPSEILVILDRSGSMSSIREDVIGGFNTFLEEQQALPGEARFTLVQFDDQFERQLDRVPLADVPKLTRDSFVPRGGTSLHDGVVRAIRDLKASIDTSNTPKIIVAIMTDGGETSSKMYRLADTYEEIRSLREAGALVLFIGANQDAIKEAAAMGIGGGQSVNFAPSAIGTRAVMSSTSSKAASYRSSGLVESYTADERLAALAPDTTGGAGIDVGGGMMAPVSMGRRGRRTKR